MGNLKRQNGDDPKSKATKQGRCILMILLVSSTTFPKKLPCFDNIPRQGKLAL